MERIFLFLIISLICLSSNASNITPDISSDWGKYGVIENKFIISGKISRLVLAGLHAVKDQIEVVEINSKGGDLDVAYVIADIIKQHGITTAVAKNGDCMSAAVVIFLAGKNRVAHSEANFMVHGVSFYSTVNQDTPLELSEQNNIETDKMKANYIDHNVDKSFVEKITSTSPDIYFNGSVAHEVGISTVINDNINSMGNGLKFDWTRPELNLVDEIAELYKLKPILVSPMTGTTN